MRVIAPDVGGGFGSKIYLYPEDVALVWASKHVGRPIKWTAERSESFLTDAHGRDHVTTAELATRRARQLPRAAREDDRQHGRRTCRPSPSRVPTILYATLLAGQYKTPAIYAEVKAVFTNTAPVDAYRGAGRPEATYVVERIVEQCARELKMDPGELRRQNFITTLPVRDAGRPDLRRRQLRGASRQGASRWPTWRASRRARPPPRRRARSAAWATRATSRPAASRRRTSPARSARGPACSRPARCACTRPAR